MDSLDSIIGREVGSYVVIRKIGEGGMGAAYRAASQLFPDKPRVVKVLLPDIARDPGAVDRFFQEARGAAAISHDNIVEIIDASRFPDGTPYIVMPFLDGCDLDDYVTRNGPHWGTPGRLPTGAVLRIVLQIAAGLAAAHARKIIHRDMKSSNVMVVHGANGPRAIILDFGIARVLDPSMRIASATRTQIVMGSPGFMPPEQARGLPVDVRADVYALGVIAYRMVTGRHPWIAETIPDMFLQQVTVAPPHPSDLVPDVPRAFGDAILASITPEPDRRLPDMAQLAARWINAAPGGHGIAEEVARDFLKTGPASQTVQASGTTPMAVAVSQTGIDTNAGRRRGWRLAAVALVVAVAAAATLVMMRPNSPSRDAAAAEVDAGPAVVMIPAPTVDAGVGTVAVPPPAADAAVAIDAPTSPPDAAQPLRIDAGVSRKPDRPRHRDRDAAAEPPEAGTGTVILTAMPWANVWIDGKSEGSTPIRKAIPAGRHKVKFEGPDGKVKSTTVTVRADQETRADAGWAP